MFAFGGTYQWTTVPVMAGAICLAVLERPRLARAGHGVLDLAIVAALAAIALQLVPLPGDIRQSISPHAIQIDLATRFVAPGPPPSRPLSVDPESTAWALDMAVATAVIFWCARAAFARGGTRAVARATAWIGFILSAFAIVQHATAPTLLYWRWRPIAVSAHPYGPFVNRNDLACWLVLATPLVVGYAIARLRSRRRRDAGAVDLESMLDGTQIGLAASACLMLGTLLFTLSRSGITAGAVALLVLVWLSRGRIDQRRRGWLFVAIAVLVVAAAAYTNIGALLNRMEEAMAGVGGRRAIWHDTWTMAKDFWIAGVGAGAYERSMIVYQTAPRGYTYFNHAHDEYLQLFAEGGVLLIVPVIVAAATAAGAIARRLRQDKSAAYWIRAGAASALVAVAVQNVWETGLRMPANAVLFAILAAIAVHEAE